MKCENFNELINMTPVWDLALYEFSKLSIEHPPGVQEVMSLIPTGDLDFFFVPR